MKKVLPFLCSCLLFTACAEAPGNVKETADILDGKQSNSVASEQPSNSSYASLADIRAQLKTDLAVNHSQISVSNAYVGNSDSMPTYVCSLKAVDVADYTENPALRKIVHDLFGAKLTEDNTTLVRYDDPTNPDYPAVDHPCDWNSDGIIENSNRTHMDILSYTKISDDPSIGCYIHGSGYSFGSQVSAFNNPVFTHATFSNEKVYDVWLHPVDDSVAYSMYDGTEWNVNDAIEYFENLFNQTLSVLDTESYTYKVKNLYVKNLGAEHFGYLAEMMQQDKQGNIFDNDHTNCLRFREETKRTVAGGDSFFFPEISYCYAYLKDTIAIYYKADSIKRTSVTQENEQLLTLAGAVQHLSETLADKKTVKIPCAELCYAVFCEGYPYFKDWDWEYPKNEFVFDALLCRRTCSFTLRPVWVFRTEYDVIDEKMNGEKYLVDAVTGEVTVIR